MMRKEVRGKGFKPESFGAFHGIKEEVGRLERGQRARPQVLIQSLKETRFQPSYLVE